MCVGKIFRKEVVSFDAPGILSSRGEVISVRRLSIR